mgnify:CR=1 FL=1
MATNKLKQRWKEGKAAVNAWLSIPSGYAAEVVARLQTRPYLSQFIALYGIDLHTGVQPRDGGLSRCHFRLPDRLGGVKDLALQVGQVDRVVIDDGERAYACGCQVG